MKKRGCSSLSSKPDAFLFNLDSVILSSERVYQKFLEQVAIDYEKDPLVFLYAIQRANIEGTVKINFKESDIDFEMNGSFLDRKIVYYLINSKATTDIYHYYYRIKC